MNHLPYPANPSLPRVVVPDLCAEVEQYDRCGFATYPIRQGWMAFAHESPWTDCDARVAASRAQTWLYFGLLQEFFGDEYHRPMFVCNDKITTENLSDMLQKWATKKTSKKKASNAETYVLLLLAERHSQHLDALVASARAIALSIKVLIDSLGIAAGIIDSGIRRNEAFNASPSRLLEERMVDLNWCPYWVQTYVASYSVATINYIAALTRTTMVEDHGACTTNRCVAHNVDMQHYQTKHVKDGCQCSFLGPSISKIQASINEGNVPLIRCTEAPGGRILVDVIEAEPGVEYTAISHVWSGGLGNPHSNSLPECQLRRLTQRMQDIALVESEWFWFRLIERGFKYVNIPSKAQIKSSLLSCGIKTTPRSKAIFWLDTLCVPTTLEHSALRRKAIDQMAFIYAGADRILVLDPELQDLEMENMSNEQICAYLTCCAWRTRCWPYQEGRLARDRMYLLKYGIYHHSASLRRIEKANLDIKRGRRLRNDTDVLHSAVASFWEDMNDVKNASKDLHAGEFLKTWNSLSLRSTTKSEDLHGILAVLLGLSSREILSLRLQERTKAIFQTQESLPLALLFLKDPGLRTHDIKNKWIPQYPSARLTSQYGDMAQSVPLGSFTFSAAESLSIGYLVDAAIPFHQHFCLIDDMTSEKVWTQVTGEYDEELEALYRHRPVCYILSNHLAVTHSASSSTHFVGARFYVSKYDDDGTLHLVYDSALNYYYQHPFNAAEDLLEFFDYTEVQGLRTSPEARFVLDCGNYPFNSRRIRYSTNL